MNKIMKSFLAFLLVLSLAACSTAGAATLTAAEVVTEVSASAVGVTSTDTSPATSVGAVLAENKDTHDDAAGET